MTATTVAEHAAGIELVEKIEQLAEALDRALQLGREIGWTFGDDNFEEHAGYRLDDLPLGAGLRAELWELLYGQWGSDSMGEKGWANVPRNIEDVRALLALTRARLDEKAGAS